MKWALCKAYIGKITEINSLSKILEYQALYRSDDSSINTLILHLTFIINLFYKICKFVDFA